jgi:hypothetical protein
MLVLLLLLLLQKLMLLQLLGVDEESALAVLSAFLGAPRQPHPEVGPSFDMNQTTGNVELPLTS